MRALIIPSLVLVAACGGPSEAEKLAEEAAAEVEAVDEVRDNQTSPLSPITPQPIAIADIEENNLFGASCSFHGSKNKEDILFLAMAEIGVVKLDGEIIKLAPDAGSDENPLGARSTYDGLSHSVNFNVDAEHGEQTGMEAMQYPAALAIADASGRQAYAATGFAVCGV